MSFENSRARRAGFACALTVSILAIGLVSAQKGPRFYPDDPLATDNDSLLDASGAQPRDLSEGYDFLTNTFGDSSDGQTIRALNVNTLDEVPDSSWFTNRIGQRAMTVAEIVRGPDSVDRLAIDEWIVTRDKGPAGFQP